MGDEEGQFVLTMLPDHEDVINEPLPDQWLEVICVYICILEPTHEGVGVCRGHFSAHCGASFLKKVAAIEVKVIALKNFVRKLE